MISPGQMEDHPSGLDSLFDQLAPVTTLQQKQQHNLYQTKPKLDGYI